MKKNYFNKLKTTLAVMVLFFSVNTVKAQCTASFVHTVYANGSVNFQSTSTGSTVISWNWAFANGNTSNVPNPSTTYTTPGVYSVTLSIATSSMSSCTASVVQNVTITSVYNCTLGAANYSSANGANGLVNFTNLTAGTTPATQYFWSFGDQGASTSILKNPSFTYTANGTYFVNLAVKDSNNTCQSNITKSVTVSNIACNVVSNFTYNMGAAGAANFTATSTGTVSGTQFYWNFGDGSGFNQGPAVISHTYTNNGVYTASLLTNNSPSFTCTDDYTTSISITNSGPCTPVASFTLQKAVQQGTWTPPPGLWYGFSTYPNNIVSATWSWGDGSPNTVGLYPTHTYTATGWYTVCQTISVSCGTTATTCSLTNIFKMDPAAGMATLIITNDPNAMSIGQSITYENAEMAVYPNPHNGSFKFEMSKIETDSKTISISVFNILGEEVYRTSSEHKDGKLSKNIDMGTMPEGTYLIKVYTGLGTYSIKTIVQKQ